MMDDSTVNGGPPTTDYEISGSTATSLTTINDNDSDMATPQHATGFKQDFKQEEYTMSDYQEQDNRLAPMESTSNSQGELHELRPNSSVGCSSFTPPATSNSVMAAGTIFTSQHAANLGGYPHAASTPGHGVAGSGNSAIGGTNYSPYLTGSYYSPGSISNQPQYLVSTLYPQGLAQPEFYGRQDLGTSSSMLDEAARYAHSRAGGPSTNDPGVWRPY